MQIVGCFASPTAYMGGARCVIVFCHMPNILAIAGPNSKYKLPGATPAGFWAGFWHGMIAPLLFWISLCLPGVRVYETNNKGRWYDFGFLFGVGAWASHSEIRRATSNISA